MYIWSAHGHSNSPGQRSASPKTGNSDLPILLTRYFGNTIAKADQLTPNQIIYLFSLSAYSSYCNSYLTTRPESKSSNLHTLFPHQPNSISPKCLESSLFITVIPFISSFIYSIDMHQTLSWVLGIQWRLTKTWCLHTEYTT